MIFNSVNQRLGQIFCFLFCAFCPCLHAETIKLPPKEKFYLVLLAGQSNMAGRGTILPEDRAPYPRVLMLNKEGKWMQAAAPVHFDKSGAGIGPGDIFGKLLAESDPEITVGLIPTACGGSSIKHWQPGAYWEQTESYPYDEAVARMNIALPSGTLKAILWHQGEADCYVQNAEEYEARLRALIADFRLKFHAENVPVIIGQLPQFYKAPWDEATKRIDAAHRKIASECQPAAFVSSDHLTSNPDKVHLNRTSQLEFGKRYFEAYRQLTEK